jgi:hypothetical protein
MVTKHVHKVGFGFGNFPNTQNNVAAYILYRNNWQNAVVFSFLLLLCNMETIAIIQYLKAIV